MEKVPTLHLYHGTDARIVKMTSEDRRSLRENIFKTLDYMWEILMPYYEPYGLGLKFQLLEKLTDATTLNNLSCALNHENARRRGSLEWQCPSNIIYLTRDIIQAADYAYDSYVFGELGRNTWDIYKGIKALNLETWHPTVLIVDTLNILKNLAETTPEPVICVIPLSALDMTKLKEDTGKDYDEYSQMFSYEYDDSFLLTYRNKTNVIHLQQGKKLTLK